MTGLAQTHRRIAISVMDNGNRISITQDKAGIAVAVNGQLVRTRNVAELRKNFPDAFRIYEKHAGGKVGHVGQADATALMREELGKLRDENAGDPQLRALLDTMMQNVAQ